MFAIDNPTAAASAPPYPAAGAPAHFSGGDPSTLQAATIVDPWWLDQIQQELLGVLSAGGVTPSKGVNTQVATAIANMISSATTPAGQRGAYYMQTAPAGWLPANGAAVSRTTYASLFAAIGTTFGAGDGATTFNLPDARGQFIRGWDNGRGLDPGRGFGSSQSDAMQGHLHGPGGNMLGYAGDTSPNGGRGTNGGGSLSENASANTGSPVTDGVNGTPRVAAETRPTNIALLECIKY